jgi:selenocysteine lyase/cysteine desulfurase
MPGRPPKDTDNGVSRRAVLHAAAGTLAIGVPPLYARTPALQQEPASPQDVTDEAWRAVRSAFLLQPGLAYMNNASLGMPPAAVVDAVASGYRAISEEPLHGKHDLQQVIADEVLPGLERIFNADAGEIVLTRNASEALDLQAAALQLQPGDEVLISTQEHPAGRRPWMYRRARHDIRVREIFIPSPLTSAADVVSRFEAEISPRTRAIAFCHVTRGGHRYPVRRLCRMARQRGLISLVDGAQAVGQFAIDLHDLDCDAYAASLHKWILAPAGTGFLFVHERARDVIRSTFEPEPDRARPGLAPPGTADFPVRAAIATALDFVTGIGLDAIERRCRYLSDYLRSGLAEIPGVTLLSGPPELSAPGSTIFEKRGVDAVAAVPAFEAKARAHIDEHQRDGHNAIRVSTHVYNTTGEIDRFLRVLAASDA